MVLGEAPDHRRAPVVADPDGLLGAQPVQQFDHVGDDLFLAIGVVGRIAAGTAIAAHVRRDGAKTQAGEHGQLVTPGNRQLWPAVHEDDRGGALSAARQVEAGVPRTLGDVFGDREGHGRAP